MENILKVVGMGGRDLSPIWGGIWWLGVGGMVVLISLLIDND